MTRKNELIEQIYSIEKCIFSKWCKAVPNDVHINMAKYLLVRLEDNQLATNFDDQVILKSPVNMLFNLKTFVKIQPTVCFEFRIS